MCRYTLFFNQTMHLLLLVVLSARLKEFYCTHILLNAKELGDGLNVAFLLHRLWHGHLVSYLKVVFYSLKTDTYLLRHTGIHHMQNLAHIKGVFNITKINTIQQSTYNMQKLRQNWDK